MIRLNNLSYRYDRNKNILNEISIDFKPGRIYGVLGKNGEGKSTLLKIICGLLQPQGSCIVDDYIPFEKKAGFLSKISFVPELPFAENITIIEMAEITSPFYPDFDYALFASLLNDLEIPANSLHNMSQGQQKKALIALALAYNTPYLLMDEPTNGLDIPSKSKFRKIIASHINDNRTIIISTHQVRDLENLIDSVVILDNQECVLDNSIFEIEDKLSFRALRPEDDPLYTETSVRGDRGIMLRNGDDEQVNDNIDLELLFNAVIENKNIIHDIFSK